MSAFRKIIITRHNLLGAQDGEDEGTILNEIFYDEKGNETERKSYTAEGELDEHQIYQVFDGRTVEESLELEGELSERTVRTFDEHGRVVSETHHYLEGETDVTTYVYDGKNLILKHVVDSDGEEGEKEEWKYEDGKIVSEVQYSMFGDIEREKLFDYDDNGLLSSTSEKYYKDGIAEETVSFYDEKGRMTTEKKYNSKNQLIARTVISYSDNGKPVLFEEETVRGKKITRLEYDDAGNNTIQEEADQNGQRLSYIERTFTETGEPLTAEIIMEPSLYQGGQHYRLEYKYE